jgi:putative PIN family toxin of toxin-antitoxin system
MKVFFDTNLYVAEVMLGGSAERMVQATSAARWRVYCNSHVLDEVHRILTQKFGFNARLGRLTQERIRRRSTLVVPLDSSRHKVAQDPEDSPILQSAIAAGVDFLVTNDKVLLALNPYEGLRIISMTDYFTFLVNEGFLNP